MGHFFTHHTQSKGFREIYGGVGLACLTIILSWCVPESFQTEFFALLLAGIVGAYIGFMFSGTLTKRGIFVEVAVMFLFAFLLLAGVIRSVFWIVVGYFLHGVWDFVHHGVVRPKNFILVPEWYVFGCLIYDWVIGVYLILHWWN